MALNSCPVAGQLDIKKEETDKDFYDYIEQLKGYEDQTLENEFAPPLNKPDWFDSALFAKGQQFALKYYFSVNFSEMLSLYLLFSHSTNLNPLIYTRKSDSIETASKRYFRTILRVLSWFKSDPWDKQSDGYKNLVAVRSFHLNTSKKLNSQGMKQAVNEINQIKSDLNIKPRHVQYLDNIEPGPSDTPTVEDIFENCPVFISQVEMTLTLFGFMGLVVLFPEKLGIHGATDDEIYSFIYLWRVIGHMLGVKDEINFCNGTLSEVKKRCEDFLKYYYIPKLYKLQTDWEHMSKCMVEGIQKFIEAVTFNDTLMYLFWLLDLKFEQFWKRVSWRTIIRYYIKRIVLQIFLRIRVITDILNFLLLRELASLEKLNYGS